MDDTNLHLTFDLGTTTLRDLSRFNTSMSIDIGPNILKAAKYLACGIVCCKFLQVRCARIAPTILITRFFC
jgi:hypothetical protein